MDMSSKALLKPVSLSLAFLQLSAFTQLDTSLDNREELNNLRQQYAPYS
jgi:hypothetical protein